MNKDLQNKILNQFFSAINKLEEGLKQPKDDFIRDACIQRFEFTFELAWKTIKQFSYSSGLIINSPREAFKIAFKLGFIGNDAIWLEMLEYRNLTTHTYNVLTADQIYNALPKFLRLFQSLHEKLINQ